LKAKVGGRAECSHLRSAYQDQHAAGLLTLEELASKLAKVEETREDAKAELKALIAREERASSRPPVTPSGPPTPRRCRRP